MSSPPPYLVEMQRPDGGYVDVAIVTHGGSRDAIGAAQRLHPEWTASGTARPYSGRYGEVRHGALFGHARYRAPALPRAAGRRTAATLRSMGAQARKGETFTKGLYASWWPRDHAGRFAERCTGPRSRCQIGLNNPDSYDRGAGMFRSRGVRRSSRRR